ncbi:hypothetical protein D9758_010059 [Tetrapyrgos nigripes]|uniref:USP domain-containing protein n=1 Tax=Tetrapyrgos nigripes TaxID=182062 RepID=A0A8H5CWP6_9AGAR|nr:hypothetical protein D9758_010059 [Tetrapyrgos nigripes]
MTQMMPQEQESVSLLASMAAVDHGIALRVLRKHNGNMERAAEALITGDRGESPQPPKTTSIDPSATVIDLTGDDNDEEMNRALQMSLDESASQPQFGPSTRPPDPNWSMVPASGSHLSTPRQSTQEDENLKEAIKASLAEPDNESIPNTDDMVRDEDGRPVALRPDDPSLAYAALVLHALFHVPQVRQRLSRLMLPTSEQDLKEDSAEVFMFKLLELFTNMDLAKISAIFGNDIYDSLRTPRATQPDLPVEISRAFIDPVTRIIEQCLEIQEAQESPPRQSLFMFSSARIEISPLRSSAPHRFERGTVVTVEVGHDPKLPNELVARLASILHTVDGDVIKHEGIDKPSEVVIFQLKTYSTFSTSNLSMANEGFVYPRLIYMDRFLLENFHVTNEKNKKQREIISLIADLEKKKEEITKSDNTDTIANLKTAINYYENVARDGNMPERRTTLDTVTQQLKTTLAALEAKLERIDIEVNDLRQKLDNLFECPELQNHPYELRAVLVHTGLSGRKHIYSYVQDTQCRWWKTVDYTVSQVSEEEVLGDTKGVALGAGPYMLIYSRSLTPEQLKEPCPWPEAYVAAVNHHNETFLATLKDGYSVVQDSNAEASDTVPALPPRPREREVVSLEQKANEDVSMMDMTSS